jgi:hypothetical protein
MSGMPAGATERPEGRNCRRSAGTTPNTHRRSTRAGHCAGLFHHSKRIQQVLGFSKITTNQAQVTTLAALTGVPNAAGSGAGASVTVAVSFTDQYGTSQLPVGNGAQNYSVQITPSQNCFIAITNKTSTGFNVALTPTTLGAGTFDVVVVG